MDGARLALGDGVEDRGGGLDGDGDGGGSGGGGGSWGVESRELGEDVGEGGVGEDTGVGEEVELLGGKG